MSLVWIAMNSCFWLDKVNRRGNNPADPKVLIILKIRTEKASVSNSLLENVKISELYIGKLRTIALGGAAMNKKTKSLTTEQYKEIIQTMREGFTGCRPNERIATALVLEGNLGLRISDILKLRLCDIVRDGDRFRLEVMEQKTGKKRVFTVPLVIQQYMENYCLRNGIRRNDLMFPITERAVQKQLHIVCDYLGYEGISTHSFRKWYATEIYNANGFDIALVQRLLQHSSAATTQRYIGIEPQKIEQAIQNHAQLI